MPSSVEMDRDSSSSNRASGIVARPIPLNEGLCVVVARRRNFGFKARGVAEYQPSLKVIHGLVRLPMVRAVRSSRRSTEIESVAMKVPSHDPRGAYCSAARATSPEFTASKARPSLAHPATKGKALSFAKTISAADLAASWWTHGSPGSLAAACFY